MNDLISRKWLMECVEEGWIKFDTEKDENRFIHLVRDIVPSAERKGHWETYLKEGLKYKCSVCGSRFNLAWIYCPRCGAKNGE